MTWKIEERRFLKRVNFRPLGDLHIGADTTEYEALDETIESIRRDSHASVALMGDLVEMAIKPHMQREQTIPPHRQIQELKNILRPIRNKIDFIIEGNHEKRVTKAIGVDYLADTLIDAEQPKHSFAPNATFLGYEGFVRYTGQHKDHLLYLHHGEGKSMTTFYLLNKAIQAGFDIADAIIIAHGHKSDVHKFTRWEQNGDIITPRTVYGIRTGSYMGHPQYAKNSLMTAGSKSDITIRLTDKMEVIWT